MEAAADTTVLTILGTAFGVMFAAVITLMFASMRSNTATASPLVTLSAT